jgi:hypothetical protein
MLRTIISRELLSLPQTTTRAAVQQPKPLDTVTSQRKQRRTMRYTSPANHVRQPLRRGPARVGKGTSAKITVLQQAASLRPDNIWIRDMMRRESSVYERISAAQSALASQSSISVTSLPVATCRITANEPLSQVGGQFLWPIRSTKQPCWRGVT